MSGLGGLRGLVTPGARRTAYDLAALVARVGVGAVFAAHGLQKAESGLSATASMFGESGVPMAPVAAAYSMIVEIGAGALLVLGLFTPLAGLLLFVNMLGAFIFVHVGNGIFVTDGGFELVAALGLTALLLAAGGAGRFSLDHVLFGPHDDRDLDGAGQGGPSGRGGGSFRHRGGNGALVEAPGEE